MEKTDDNILLDDEAIHVKLGSQVVEFNALPIKASIKWMRECQEVKNRFIVKAAECVQAGKPVDGSDIETFAECVWLHTPSMDRDIIDNATTGQILAAYEALCDLENPTKRLIQAYQR